MQAPALVKWWWGWGGVGGQARTDVFKLAGKVKWRRRGGETSPKALLLSSKHFLVLNLNPPSVTPQGGIPWPGWVSPRDGRTLCWCFEKRAAIVAQWVETWITQHIWDELNLWLCDITAPCDCFSTLIYTFSYCVHTSTRVQTHCALLCCHTDSGGIRWWWEQSMRPGYEQHTHWALCEQFKFCSKCYNKHTRRTHKHPCVVFVFALIQLGRKGRKKNPFEIWNSSPSAAPVLPSTRPGAERQQQENTGLCCLSRSPLDTFWTPSPNGRRSIEALLYWGACERTADLSVVSNVTRYCNKVGLRWQSSVCVCVCTYSYCMSLRRQAWRLTVQYVYVSHLDCLLLQLYRNKKRKT